MTGSGVRCSGSCATHRSSATKIARRWPSTSSRCHRLWVRRRRQAPSDRLDVVHAIIAAASAFSAMSVFKAILLKLASALLFAVMQALVRWLGDTTPVGQVVFYRSAFAILPVVIIYAWRGELMGALRTSRPLGHAGRGIVSIGGMFSNFAALARLPLVEATAIQFASPLITVAMAAL